MIDDATRSIDVTLATEAPTRVLDFRSLRMVDEVLRMDGLDLERSSLVLLADHDNTTIDAIRGRLRDIRIDGDRLVARATISDDAQSEKAWLAIRDGHLTDVSAGYHVLEAIDIPPGNSQSVGGRDYTAGARALRVATRWAPIEGSLVAIGADPSAKFDRVGKPAGQAGGGRVAVDGFVARSLVGPSFDLWLSNRSPLSLANISTRETLRLLDQYRRELHELGAGEPPPAPFSGTPQFQTRHDPEHLIEGMKLSDGTLDRLILRDSGGAMMARGADTDGAL